MRGRLGFKYILLSIECMSNYCDVKSNCLIYDDKIKMVVEYENMI